MPTTITAADTLAFHEWNMHRTGPDLPIADESALKAAFAAHRLAAEQAGAEAGAKAEREGLLMIVKLKHAECHAAVERSGFKVWKGAEGVLGQVIKQMELIQANEIEVTQ